MSDAQDNGQWAIETENLSKHFGSVRAVDGLNLRIRSGVLYGLIGPNGAGKTTTLRLLAGLIEPTSGSIRLRGRPVALGGGGSDGLSVVGRSGAGQIQRQVGYMPDFFGVYEDMRAWEYLDFFGRCYSVPREEREVLVTELLELVGLSHKRDTDVHELSRGMKQRLCLAHALVHDPELLLLDEPASGLDPRARLEIRELLVELRAMGKTVLISSHILAELAEMCDSVGIMESGKLLASGPVDEIERQLQLGQVIRIRTAASPVTAAEVLASLAGVEIVSAVDDPSAVDGGEVIEIRLASETLGSAQVLSSLVGAGVVVKSFSPRERDLEGLFMRLTKGEIG